MDWIPAEVYIADAGMTEQDASIAGGYSYSGAS
jgi:hypothetical protein